MNGVTLAILGAILGVLATLGTAGITAALLAKCGLLRVPGTDEERIKMAEERAQAVYDRLFGKMQISIDDLDGQVKQLVVLEQQRGGQTRPAPTQEVFDDMPGFER